MPRRTVFLPYQPKTILNKGQRADHWFWTRYSAYPYTGCQHGCEFCYCRERKFCPHDDPLDFPYVIRVKENAPALLRRDAGPRAPRRDRRRRLPARRAQVPADTADARSLPGAGLPGLHPEPLAPGAARPRSAAGDQRARPGRRRVQRDLGARLAELRPRLRDGATGPARREALRGHGADRRSGDRDGHLLHADPARRVRRRRQPGGGRTRDGGSRRPVRACGRIDPGRPAARLLLRRAAGALSGPGSIATNASIRWEATGRSDNPGR